MSKERSPIATRTRNRTQSVGQDDKANNNKSAPSNDVGKADSSTPKESSHQQKLRRQQQQAALITSYRRLPYLPKQDSSLYLDELNLPTSYLRSSRKKQPDKKRKRKGLGVPLPISNALDEDNKLTAKEKEKEVSRRQRRAFINSRYVTEEECMLIAKSVYPKTTPEHLNAKTRDIKKRLSRYHDRFNRILDKSIGTYDLSKEELMSHHSVQQTNRLKQKLNQAELQKIWGSWLAEPSVDAAKFYKQNRQFRLLASVTAEILIVHLKQHYDILTDEEAEKQLKRIDLLSRTLILPTVDQ